MKPLIGITCSEGDSRLFINRQYAAAVVEAGGLPLLLPGLAGIEAELVKRLDGILFSGGDDVDPFFFGEEPHPGTGDISPERDAFEIALARLALAAGLPILGICRGIQILNILIFLFRRVSCYACHYRREDPHYGGEPFRKGNRADKRR